MLKFLTQVSTDIRVSERGYIQVNTDISPRQHLGVKDFTSLSCASIPHKDVKQGIGHHSVLKNHNLPILLCSSIHGPICCDSNRFQSLSQLFSTELNLSHIHFTNVIKKHKKATNNQHVLRQLLGWISIGHCLIVFS